MRDNVKSDFHPPAITSVLSIAEGYYRYEGNGPHCHAFTFFRPLYYNSSEGRISMSLYDLSSIFKNKERSVTD